VRLDADAMKQAVLNILVNAQQAMPDGGEMIVRTTLNVSGAVIEVVDTGCGIPSENNDKVFRPYFSTKRGGTGLGLPTARRIVEEHGGRIAFDSEVGKGTCFRILLPLAPQATPPEDCPEEA
jgi:signal transduction histidine kinase